MTDWRDRTALLLGRGGWIGGVGSFAAEALARAGIGRLVLVDGDVVDVTNLNRQLVALRSTVGQPKAEAMARRIGDINPDCRVETHSLFYLPPAGEDPGCGRGLIDGCDFVADAIDSVTSKLGLAEECRDKGIPLISAMGCGNKLDPTRFRVADIQETKVCPLCRVMRRELKKRGIGSLTVVYSEEPPRGPLEELATPAPGRRAVPGSISFVPSAAGLILAGEIIRRLGGVD